DERTERMIDDGFLVADSLAFFRQRVNFRMGRVAEEERDIAIVKQVDNFLDGRLELSMIIQKIMADLERFVPGERGGQLAARGGRVPPRLSAADLTQSIRVHSHRHP